MFRALSTAATGIEAQQTQIEVVANNLANVNTAGFKKSRADFQGLLCQAMHAAGATTKTGQEIPVGLQVGFGVRSVRAAAVVESAHHAAHIAELRALIEAGRYDVSSEDLAEAILREEVLPWIVK